MIRWVWLAGLAWGCGPQEMDLAGSTGLDGDPATTSESTTAGNSTTSASSTTTAPDTTIDGVWAVLDRQLTRDECGMADWLEQQELGTVTMVGDWVDGFELTHSRGIEWCTEGDASDDAYRCDLRQDEDTRVQEDYGIDALLILDIWVTGTLDSDGALAMTTEILTDCEGSGCWLAALDTGGFPCHSTVVVNAEPN